jgi:glycosyltransferase involved in cell wall biosynthesis
LALQAVKLAGFDARASRDLERDLAHAGLFVYITQSEGLGSAVLLAMAAGVPVITSNVGGLPEIVEHESTGLLTANTPDAIAGSVRRLMQDRALAQSLSPGHVRWSKKNFRWNKWSPAPSPYMRLSLDARIARRLPRRTNHRQLSQCLYLPLAA